MDSRAVEYVEGGEEDFPECSPNIWINSYFKL